jgi:hypothetical protein
VSDDPFDHSAGGTSETVSLVPGLNQIGAMLDDLRKNIQANQRWALKDWVQGAKLLVIAADVHGLKSDNYVQYAIAHLPIEGKTQAAKKRAAYDLYLLGYAQDGQPANGDLIIQECEAQEKLRHHNFEWPYWRNVTARLRREAREKEQGDGKPAGDADPDADEDKEDVEPDADESTEDAAGLAPDAPEKDTRPVDPVAPMDAEITKLRTELDTARQRIKSERAAREEVQDALIRLRSDIARVLSASEKALWDTRPPEPPGDPEPLPTESQPGPPEPIGEGSLRSASVVYLPSRESKSPSDLEPPRTANAAVNLIYLRRQTETCETVAAALSSVPMGDWERDDFDRLKEELDGVADWSGDHNETAWAVCSFETAPVSFGTADGVLLYEDGLVVLTWPQAMDRVAPQVEAAKHKRELERRQHAFRNIIARTLPARRKLKAMKALVDEVLALQPTEIKPEGLRAIDFIRAMPKDDERFAICRTFADYLRRAIDITAPPEFFDACVGKKPAGCPA